ncbi:MAG: AraC family transcriptional regulator, partial [Saprospiraceae bacterium]|nr:AraC family transcriptional regulator [Saprospiraceae bacterium]
ADTSPWRDFYACPVRFSAKANTARIPVAVLDKVLPSANPGLAQLHEDIVVQYLERLDQEDLPGRVRAEIVRHLPSDNFSQAAVATALNTTPRTMRRVLRSHGTTFNSLLADVRQELAGKFVADDSISVTEMSFMLGFSEVSSFTRAFRKWNGFPPSAARQGAGRRGGNA